jgi:Transcriptional regulator, AbiEi antitoxin N-terminal domain
MSRHLVMLDPGGRITFPYRGLQVVPAILRPIALGSADRLRDSAIGKREAAIYQNDTKLKILLATHLPGTVSVAPWLERHGISRDLQTYYRRSGWLETAGTGAFSRPGETVGWQGGLYALQTQSQLPIHAGSLTALALQGYGHYVRLGSPTVFLFSQPKVALSAWFRNHDWEQAVRQFKTSFPPEDLTLTHFPNAHILHQGVIAGAGNAGMPVSLARHR